MTNSGTDPKRRRFHYSYVFEGLFGLVTLGVLAVIPLGGRPWQMFATWYLFLLAGGIVIFFLKRRMERDIARHLGDEKMKLIYTIGVYWVEGGLFVLASFAVLVFIALKALGRF